MTRRARAAAVARFVPDCAILFARLLRDERVPRRRKLLLGAVAGYLALPFDVVPDVLPLVGQLDDLVVVAWALRSVVRTGGPDLVRELWPGPAVSLDFVLRLATEAGQPERLRAA